MKTKYMTTHIFKPAIIRHRCFVFVGLDEGREGELERESLRERNLSKRGPGETKRGLGFVAKKTSQKSRRTPNSANTQQHNKQALDLAKECREPNLSCTHFTSSTNQVE
jgi:hypothetical protein